MIALWRLAPLALLLMGLAVIAAAVLIVPWAVQAQDPEVTPTAGSTGSNPPAKPTNLRATSEHDAVTLTWTASTDQTVTHYAVLRRNRDEDASQVFHVIESNAGPGTSYTDGTVSASTTYIYRVKAVSPTGVSEWSGYVKADTPAAPPATATLTPTPTDTPEPEPESSAADQAPTGLSAALADGSGVNLSWSAPAEEAGSVTGYEVLRAVGEGELATLAADTGSTTTTYTDATATDAGETYAYRVKAIRGSDRSQASGQAQVQVPHDPADLKPTGLTVSLVDNQVTLSWTAPKEDAASVTGYEILRRRPMAGESALATLVADTESTATTYTDASANEAGVRYVYRVKALRGSDVSRWSNFARIELPSDYVAPQEDEPESTSDDEAPSGLSAALAEGGGVALTWTAPSEDAGSVTGYEVLRAVGEGELASLVDDTGSTATAYTDATATAAGETYAYQVKAIRGSDRSDASGQAQVQVPHDPVDLAPTGLSAVVLTASVVVVGEDSTATTSISVSLSWSSPAEDTGTITGYEVLRAVGEGELGTLVADTGSTATFYNDATATLAGTSYTYKVKAIRGGDRSQASGQARVQVPHAPVDLAPSDLTAEAADGGVDLSWTAPAEDADTITGYEVLRAVGEGELATLVADTASTATTYTDATATEEGETYAYRVRAIRGEARSQGSNRVALVPVEPPATPENLKPTNLTFEIREDGVTLAWDAPAADAGSVTGYRVLRRRPDQGENKLLVWETDTGTTETTYKDAYAQDHGEYYVYRVRALRGNEQSKMSNFVDVRRPEATPQTTEWAPSNLVALMTASITIDEQGNIQIGDDTVQLTWDAPAEGVEWVRGYEVQRATCNGDFTSLVSDTGSTATAHVDAEFEEGESYTYRVRARRPQGLSLWSGTQTLLVPGGTGESDCAVPLTSLPSTVQDPQTGLTPATLLNTLLGYDEAEGTGTLAPNELVFGEDGAFRVTSVNAWPGNPGLVLYLTAGTSEQDAALADRDFVLEADETVLVVGETEFSFDDAMLSHSDTTGDNAEYTGVVIATWTEGQAGLVAGETVDFRLVLRNRPDEPQHAVMVDLDSDSNGFLQVAAGWFHMCALRKDGTVSCWGKFGFRGIYANPNPPKSPDGIYDQIVAGKDSSCGVRSDGKAMCWDDANWDDAKKMVRINNDKPKKWIHTFTQSGVCWLNRDGTLGCSGDHHGAPDGEFKSVSTGWNFGCALNLDDEAVCWNFGKGLTPPTGEFRFLQAGGSRVCGIRKDTGDVDADQTLVCWEWEGPATRRGQYYSNSYHFDENSPPDGKFKSVYVHQRQTCGVTVAGDIKCWMGAGNNELPLVKKMNLLAPPGEFEEVSMNWYHYACGLKTDTSIACWKYDGTVMDTPSLETPWHDNADLLSLSLSGIAIAFDRDTQTYTAAADNTVETTTVAAGATNRFAAVSISPADDSSTTDGHQVDLTVGSNTITITVTAADGMTTKTYTVMVTRAS